MGRSLLFMIIVCIFGLATFHHFSASNAQTNDIIDLAELDGLPTLILVTVNDGSSNNLALYDWSTDELTLIVTSSGNEGHATWSPDAQLIAFQSLRDADGNWEIYTYHVDTGEELNLTNAASNDMYPNWTRDGLVIYMSDQSGEPALWLTDPATGSMTELTANDDCVPDYHPNASWTEDRVAYRADCSGNGDIWHLDIITGERINLTADTVATDRYPDWSPDGEKILFVSNRDGNEEIYVMHADGSNPINLSQHAANDVQGSWSPDGRFIVFVSDRDGQDDLWIMEADGTRPTKLASKGIAFNWPWWQPIISSEDKIMDHGNADVEFVRAIQASDGTWRFDVTVRHPDIGWEDYADGWDVVLPDGTILKVNPADTFTRLLLHPHETEQPFTRSQSGLAIPEGVSSVRVRAHDLVDGWGGREIVVDLTQDAGEGFEIVR